MFLMQRDALVFRWPLELSHTCTLDCFILFTESFDIFFYDLFYFENNIRVIRRFFKQRDLKM